MRLLPLGPVAFLCVLSAACLPAQEPAASPVPTTSTAPTAPADAHTLFNDRGCAHCHGPEAGGTERGPDLRLRGRKLKPDEIRHQIVDGGKEMPAFGDALTPEETDALVAWVHTLKPARKAKSR